MFISFALYDSNNVALTTATPAFQAYKNKIGTNISAPVILNLGNGLYGFTALNTDVSEGRAYEINSGAGANPNRFYGSIGPLIAFGLYDNTGTPYVSATPSFTVYKNKSGVTLPSPSIVNLGNGLYGFIPSYSDREAYVSYIIDCGASVSVKYHSGILEPDLNIDPNIQPTDTVSPTVFTIRSIDARTIEVTFSEAVQELTALNSNNYSINNGLSVTAVAKVSPSIYRLTTSQQTTGTSYLVTINNIKDLAGNVI